MQTFKNAENIENRISGFGLEIVKPVNDEYPKQILMPFRFIAIHNGVRTKGAKGQYLVFTDFNTAIISDEPVIMVELDATLSALLIEHSGVLSPEQIKPEEIEGNNEQTESVPRATKTNNRNKTNAKRK